MIEVVYWTDVCLPVVDVFVLEGVMCTSMCSGGRSLPRNGGTVTSVTVRI